MPNSNVMPSPPTRCAYCALDSTAEPRLRLSHSIIGLHDGTVNRVETPPASRNSPSEPHPVPPSMAAAAGTGWQPRESRDEQAERICQPRFRRKLLKTSAGAGAALVSTLAA